MRKLRGCQFRDDIDAVHNALIDLSAIGRNNGDPDEVIAASVTSYLAELSETHPDLAWPVYEKETLH